MVWNSKLQELRNHRSDAPGVLTDNSFDPGDDNAMDPWQSFDHPTDVWVPGSQLHSLNLESLSSSRAIRHDTMILLRSLGSRRAASTPSFVSDMMEGSRLDIYGNLVHTWVVPTNICSVPSLCGPNSMCSYTSLMPCSCPTGSRQANEDWAQGCTTSSKISRIAVGVGAGAALLLLLGLIIGIMRILKTKKVPSSGKCKSDDFAGGELAHFTPKQLHAATDRFKQRSSKGVTSKERLWLSRG
ncbi:hypothetical protein SELMODRAFT_427879 [Selaginella moellendorffii]|uniref:Uncharacterized protein n=1 Tax=Selaginella moellendorffii TaxID=88036 RepID=D8T103_SELML|nr:hypothetical protein SELMODRAFT_427879 [Selaginella moellendorffii]